MAKTRVELIINRLQNHKVLCWIIIIAIIIIAIANLTGALTSLYGLVKGIFINEQPANLIQGNQVIQDDEDQPQGFDVNDPNIINISVINLRTEEGSEFWVGNCPDKPCFIILYRKLILPSNPPAAEFSVGGHTDMWQSWDLTAFGFQIKLRRHCGFKFRTPFYDLILEIRDENINSLNAWVAIYEGSRSEGHLTFDAFGCE